MLSIKSNSKTIGHIQTFDTSKNCSIIRDVPFLVYRYMQAPIEELWRQKGKTKQLPRKSVDAFLEFLCIKVSQDASMMLSYHQRSLADEPATLNHR